MNSTVRKIVSQFGPPADASNRANGDDDHDRDHDHDDGDANVSRDWSGNDGMKYWSSS